MTTRVLWLLALLPMISLADDARSEYVGTSVIEMNMCIPSIDGQSCLHVDNDVTGLIIEVLSCDGTQKALYDSPLTEVQDIAVIGTYAAPDSGYVRVSPQGNSGADLTQMMFADAVYAGEDCITISVTDGQTTIMDYVRHVDLVGDMAYIVEPNGSRKAGDILSWLLAEAVGECDYNTGTSTWTCTDPEGTSTRFVIVYGTDSGDRTSSTLTEP